MPKITPETELQKRFRFQRDLQVRVHPTSDYLIRNWQGKNCIHLAAAFGGIDHIPKELLTSENLGDPDSNGDSPLHIAALNGRIAELPIEDIHVGLFFKKNKQNQNVFMVAEAHGTHALLPDHIRSQDPSKIDQQIRSWVISNEAEMPDELRNPALWKAPTLKDISGAIYLHLVAEHGLLHRLPIPYTDMASVLIENNLGEAPLSLTIASGRLREFLVRIPSDFDWSIISKLPRSPTYFHLLAKYKQLSLLEAVELEDLLLKDASGTTVLDELYYSGDIEIVPKEIRWLQKSYLESKSKDLILLRQLDKLPDNFQWVQLNSDGETPLHFVASQGLLHLLPNFLLTKENLESLNVSGKSVATIAFECGHIEMVPEDLRCLAKGFVNECIRLAIQNGSLANVPDCIKTPEFLLLNADYWTYETFLHQIAATGLMGQVPLECLHPNHLGRTDRRGNTVLHTLVKNGKANMAPSCCFSDTNLLGRINEAGESVYQIAAALPMLGKVPVTIFTQAVLISERRKGYNIADIIDEQGNTPLLPPALRNCSKVRAVAQLMNYFKDEFLTAEEHCAAKWAEVILPADFTVMRRDYVLNWFNSYSDMKLDQEQAEALAECGSHIQVTARAGSGKTRTLVARALFQIKHCRIPASYILVLAFNKKAVEEIRERLMKYLSEEEMPHVLTFHALAYRIVRPDEKLIFDAGESKEGQVFSSTIQGIIDTGLRSGTMEQEIRSLMEERWTMDLNECWRMNLDTIVSGGYDLKKDELLDFRINLPSLTMDGRRMDSEADKHIGNTLFRHRIRYRYGKTIHRYAGASYAPDFSRFDKNSERFIIIEILEDGKTVTNLAREAFWKSERGERALLLQVPSDFSAEQDSVSKYVVQGLQSLGLVMSPMSDDELWEVLKDRAIDQFTKAVKQFIARCQKELVSPDELGDLIGKMSGKSHRIQTKFWQLGRKIFSSYLTILSGEGKTDFDQLMLNAAGLLQAGHVRFTSSRGDGRIDRIKQVLIDEFQDFSHLFNELRKAFISQSPDALFFCVGDDWQAINKFAGSDLSYFTNFGDTFTPFVQKVISRNYRSCRKIVEAGNLVMTGEGPPSLPHRDEPGEVHIIHVEDAKDFSEIEEMVAEELGDSAVPILRLASEFTSQGLEVAILSRNGSKDSSEGVLRLEAWEKKLREFLPESHKELLKVSTTHGYKGRESDVVIMLRPEYYPSIHPDAVFNTIFGDTLESNVTDEKRLFYVGVTRARTKLFLLHDKPPENPFRRVPSTFLRLVTNKTSYDINRITAILVCGERIIVRISNTPDSPFNSGTYSIKDQLKRGGFKWPGEGSTWSKFLDPGSISSPLECSQYLSRQPWFKEADGVEACFAWGDQQHRIRMDRGIPLAGGPSAATKNNPAPIPPHAALPAIQPSLSIAPKVTIPLSSKTFETNVAGMKYDGRMQKASGLSTGEPLQLVREPNNSHDRNAVMVTTEVGVQIGYLSRHVAAHLAHGVDALGGVLPAIVSSVWKQPVPHFLVSVQISFRLPEGVHIPLELSPTAPEESPFATRPTRIRPTVPAPKPPSAPDDPDPTGFNSISHPPAPPLAAAPTLPTNPEPLPRLDPNTAPTPQVDQVESTPVEMNTPSQRVEIHHTQVAGVSQENGAPAIRGLHVGDAIKLERETSHPTDVNAVRVTTIDARVLGYIPHLLATRIASRIDGLGGRLSATVAAIALGGSNRTDLDLFIEFEIPAHDPAPLQSEPLVQPTPPMQPASCGPPPADPSSFAKLSSNLQSELAELGDEPLRHLIAELYLTGTCGWPTLGYEAIDASGRCTGSMLEIAWPDNKIGIATPANDVGSFKASCWKILPVATVSAIDLRNLFEAGNGQDTPTEMVGANDPTSTETETRFQHGPFFDEEHDDDIPF